MREKLREKICGIYSYRDLKEGYKIVYIGQSRDIYARHRSHCRDKKYNQRIDNVILEDPKRYSIYIEELCEENELNSLEEKYISKYKPKYNYTKGGDYTSSHRKNGYKKYDKFWDTKQTHFISLKNQSRNRPFRVYWNGYYLCYVEDFETVKIIHNLINWGVA